MEEGGRGEAKEREGEPEEGGRGVQGDKASAAALKM